MVNGKRAEIVRAPCIGDLVTPHASAGDQLRCANEPCWEYAPLARVPGSEIWSHNAQRGRRIPLREHPRVCKCIAGR